MTNEVDTPPKDEADWAMDYANERALRIKAETRLASFMLDTPAFCVAVDKLIDAIFEPAKQGAPTSSKLGQEFMSRLVRVLQYSDDVGNNININIFDPVWNITDEEKTQLLNSRCLRDIPKSYRKRVDKMIKAANEAVFEEWCDICDNTSFAHPKEVGERTQQRAFELLSSVVEYEDEKQGSKTH